MPHILQPKHTILKESDAKELLEEYNISLSQLPKIKLADPSLPDGAEVGDIIKIERKDEEGKHSFYYRVVVL
jgi:DNA-directed RNA polymerase subunit H